MLNYCTNFNFIPLVRFTSRKEAIIAEKKKMGRPTDSPKTTQFSVRFDEKTLKILDTYCNKHNLSRPEAVRFAVSELKDK